MKIVKTQEKTLNPIDYYNMRSQGGVGRQEVGGVGRRRESLASEKGFSLQPTSKMVQGSLSDVSPVLYEVEHPETGERMNDGFEAKDDEGYDKVVQMAEDDYNDLEDLGSEDDDDE